MIANEGSDALEASMSQCEAVSLSSTDGELHLSTACHNCKNMGHCASNFPEQGAHHAHFSMQILTKLICPIK